MTDIRLGIVGVGKIARDQHIPSIAKTDGISIVASASRHAFVEGLPQFRSLAEMLAADVEIDAVSLCTPPQVRHADALLALKAGKHVLLEKPPGATVSEIDPLIDAARSAGVSLFATWHSRFAPAVEPARAWAADAAIESVHVEWKEDVRHWHPGQDWIWEPGGLGVFDPGINALSIVTAILPRKMFLERSTLSFPANRAQPIAASLAFRDSEGIPVTAEFDWRQTGPQTWDVTILADKGRLTLSKGGSVLSIDGTVVSEEPDAEYAGIYRRFVDLVGSGRSDVDLSPLAHVADAFLLGRREIVEPFL
ncbi:hypothetical protein ASG43_05485 [Aureimonas sp. Leaf454]|uniref:Gfo/Idh/MocA family protein n=1 Tax=Aureimonas sp. Leaf454 TaxID=1736381 RepID=UPI0006F1C95D|nr:Gfo/Idh/MocA family oxidoreductase [Aureimonas sp. Leaf454]KQT50731.1 hypothetical protein ASG43_05485 [Aureimonas sp. Leaf454]